MSKLTKQGIRDLGYSKPNKVEIPPDKATLPQCMHCKSNKGYYTSTDECTYIERYCINCDKPWEEI